MITTPTPSRVTAREQYQDYMTACVREKEDKWNSALNHLLCEPEFVIGMEHGPGDLPLLRVVRDKDIPSLRRELLIPVCFIFERRHPIELREIDKQLKQRMEESRKREQEDTAAYHCWNVDLDNLKDYAHDTWAVEEVDE